MNDIKILTDRQTRLLYSADASMYEEVPEGVCYPESREDIQELVRRSLVENFNITARGGGTSLAGQATGEGVIMDVSRNMNTIFEIDEHRRLAHLQPGVIRDTLNRAADEYGLLFGPDTSTTDRCMIGGMIGNNSTGSFSIKYGSTRDHIVEVEAVLSDGSTAVFGPLSPEELKEKKQLDSLEGQIYRGMTQMIGEHRDQILNAYPHPDIIRRNTGYALDRLCTMQPFEPEGPPFNLAELLCGSEGTLAMIASAKVRLVPQDRERILVIPQFDSLREALEATTEVVQFDPAAVELIDDIVLDATKDNIEQRKNRFFLEGEPRAVLIIQLDGNDREALTQRAEQLRDRLQQQQKGYTHPIIKDENRIKRVWNLRKAGLGLLMGLDADNRTPSFVEDTAVRVQDLPDYIDDFQQILDRHNTRCVFYAHASVGELHIRPVVDTMSEDGVQQMKQMAEEVSDLVASYGGSLSGEHGDGRARSPYIEKVLGSEMMPLLRRTKELWDPDYRFNPGKIVEPRPIDDHLRFSPEYRRPQVDTAFEWRPEGSFADALELCNGAGVCRKLAESGGTMCPSYMATREEKDSTRGRANLFRQLFEGKQAEAFSSEELKDALDLCLSCKACKSECPANVDMARMKAEFMNGWHRQNGISWSERFFGQAARFYPLAQKMAPLVNRVGKWRISKALMYWLFNISRKRSLPQFARETFHQWWMREGNDPASGVSVAEDDLGPGKKSIKENQTKTEKSGPSHPQNYSREIALFVDLFTNYHEPGIARDAVRVLRALGYQINLVDTIESGRPQLSKGIVDQVKPLVESNIEELYKYVQRDVPIIGLEPSEILTFRDDYLDLCRDESLSRADEIASQCYQLEEFLLQHEDLGTYFNVDDKTVYVHGHCHAKALVGMQPVMEVLNEAGFLPVDLKTGCCGMAGSFGYEADHYEVSMDIGELRLFPELRETDPKALICAPGFSCRHQIRDGVDRSARHPAQLLASVLR